MSEAAAPLITVGLPVFNGEAYLEEAIRSVLAQTFEDWELIVSDNASTDRTAEIARDLAASDRRVRYLRNEHNLGAAANYNRTFALARGRYFKWLAHDDRLLPEYFAKTVRVLDADPEVVLCNGTVAYIDEKGEIIGTYRSVLHLASGERPSERFAALVLNSHACVDFFGLIRRSALERSLLHAPFHGADRALLAQLALRGRMVQIPEPLVQMREHRQRYTRLRKSIRDRRAWHDPNATSLLPPALELYRAYWRLVREEPLPGRERLRCAATLLRWWFVNWHAFRVAAETLDLLVPGTVYRAERLKTRLFGAAPGHLVEEAERR
ncbi:MAG: glycosyltransferase [Geminicoccaceae bacterium]|nr:glycosyltransferase [Geminicoccaceae bacterium]MDW8125657.1 glycosyltransferase family 2 protein [Geminicoccaceae bacterium]